MTPEEKRGEREEKKIISTASLLADPISGSTVDGRRCLRVDRIAFLAYHNGRERLSMNF